MASVRVDEIVARFGGELKGDGSRLIVQVATLERAGPGDISFLANQKYRARLKTTLAGAVILGSQAAADCPVACIVCAEPYAYFARVAQWLNPASHAAPGCHTAAVSESDLPASASIAAGAVVGKGCAIGEGVVIGPGCVIGEGVVIGADSLLHANVSVYAGCVMGRRAIVHAGVVIGADGFGFAREEDGSWIKIPQIGRVVIGDDVEIGANTTIDRGALDDTVIEDGVKLDNQIQVGHNVRIGARSALAGCVGIAGSARIGRRCTVGGGAVILGHIEIADDVNISAGTLVAKSIPQAGTYTAAVPFLDHAGWLKNFSHLRHLDALADRIRALEAQVARLARLSEPEQKS